MSDPPRAPCPEQFAPNLIVGNLRHKYAHSLCEQPCHPLFAFLTLRRATRIRHETKRPRIK